MMVLMMVIMTVIFKMTALKTRIMSMTMMFLVGNLHKVLSQVVRAGE